MSRYRLNYRYEDSSEFFEVDSSSESWLREKVVEAVEFSDKEVTYVLYKIIEEGVEKPEESYL